VIETGGWVSEDLYNGRVARLPNSMVLKGSVFNYSQGFRFVWGGIRLNLTLHSDVPMAREMLLQIANQAIAEYINAAEHSWRRVTENFRIENASLQPTVALSVRDKALEFTLSYIVDYTNRTAMKDRLFSDVVLAVNTSQGRLEWASSDAPEKRSDEVLR
jgi:small-conductance mechanosensitive channel